MWLFEYFFLNSANLICRGMYISKNSIESLGIRDNGSRLYIRNSTYITKRAFKTHQTQHKHIKQDKCNTGNSSEQSQSLYGKNNTRLASSTNYRTGKGAPGKGVYWQRRFRCKFQVILCGSFC